MSPPGSSSSPSKSSPSRHKGKIAYSRLPWSQLTILAICRLADPIALSSVFPYLPEMIESFDIPDDQVSSWAGFTSSIFSISQALTGVWWGRASDAFGRKPVILCAMVGIMISFVVFGLSKTLVWAIVARGISGACNGNVGLMRTAVAELVPQKELQPLAFSIMPLVWGIGTALGPVIGGLLANPAKRYTSLFGGSAFLKEYPFALPNFVAAAVFAVGLVTGFLFLKETLETKKNDRDVGRNLGAMITSCPPCRRRRKHHLDDEQSAPLLKTSASRNQKPSPPTWREIFTRQSSMNLLVYALLALHSIAFDQLLPVYLHYPALFNLPTTSSSSTSGPTDPFKPSQPTSPASPKFSVPVPFRFIGGFALSSNSIGLIFALYACLGMATQLSIFPWLALRKGTLWNLKLVSCLFPIIYLLTPFTAYLGGYDSSCKKSSCASPPNRTGQIAGMVVLQSVKAYASTFAFPCTTILLTNSASSLRILGTLNGIAVSISAIGRAVGPGLAGWTFTIGVDTGWGILSWWVLAAWAVLAAIPVWWLEEGKSFAERAAEDAKAKEGDVDDREADDRGQRNEASDGLGPREGESEDENEADETLPMRL